MSTADSPFWSFHHLRLAVFALLTVNTAYYLYAGSLAKALDAAAWLVLLALFAFETGLDSRMHSTRTRLAIRTLRLLAALGVCGAGVGYVLEGDSLDVVNFALWISVFVLLELEVRRPRVVARFGRAFTLTAAMLYAGLALLVLVWAWRGEWFDAYDALLWLAGFAIIEMDVLASTSTNAAG